MYMYIITGSVGVFYFIIRCLCVQKVIIFCYAAKNGLSKLLLNLTWLQYYKLLYILLL